MSYRWLVYIHVAAVVVFLLAHGPSVGMALRLRREPTADGIRALVALSTLATQATYPSLILVIATGLIVGFAGHWWGRGWVWAAIGIVLVTSFVMAALASRYHRLRPVRDGGGKPPGGIVPSSSPEEVRRIAASIGAAPITLVGAVALALILWLMLLKPF
ncbi:MAG: hypothetical protein M3Z11_01650 [Candidatus Dormibacteraeota bacterium]|nr:hypothetical protein [Candidatus Dormibacteraeota bacterium]